MTPSSIWAALSLLALAAPVSSFFTINNPTLYKDFDKVDLLINKVQSPNTQLPYSYYELPFTCPTTSDISSIPLSLGQVLRGDRISKSDYQLSFKNDTECAKTCLRLVTAQGIKKAQDLIRQGYSNEWLVDDLPGSTTMINSDDNSKFYMSGFPLGFIRNGRYFLNNHVMMVIRYHKETASNDYSIVGFEVYPRSVADDHCPGAANNYQNYELSESKIKPDLKGAVVPYTYSIYWREETQVSYNQRWDLYINKEETDSIHYLSLFYSLGFAVLFSVFVSMIFTKVKSDTPTNNIAKQSNTYNSNGWRKLKNDVFSTPPYALLLSILGGAGIQLLSTVFLVVVLFAFKILNQNVPGRNLNIAVFLFISAGTISGYFAVYLYDQLTLNDPERFKKRYKAHVGSGATSYHDSIDPPPGARKFKLNNNNNGNSNNNNNNNSNNNNSIKQRSSSITAPASAASASFFSTSNSSSSSSSSSSPPPATSASFASPSSPIVKPHMKRDWFHISFFAGSALPGFLIITLLFLNFFIWAKQSSTALPFGTIVLLIVLYFFLEIPLALIGGFVSYKHALKRQEKSLILPVPVTSPISSPVLDNFDSFANDLNNSAAITNSQQQSQQPHYNKSPLGNNTNSGIQEPGYSKPSRHPIPQQPWHLRTIPNMFLFGIAPFISSYIELFYIYKVIWLEKYSFYCLYGFLFLTLLLLAVLVVESVIISLYWSLNSSGDYHWQWRSFLVGGSASIYVFLYSVLYYMVHLRAQYDFVSGMLYFVYCFLIYLLVVLMFGSVGLVAGHWFTKKIYSSVKRD